MKKIIECYICKKKMDISNWVGSICFEINHRIDDGNNEEIETIKTNDVCAKCFYDMKIMIHIISQRGMKATLDFLRGKK